MNIKRSYFKLLMASAGVGLFLANCTVKQGDDECERGDKDSGCDCPGNAKGYQVCDSDGVFGECICPDGNTAGTSGENTAGKNSSTGGTSGDEGGAPSSSGGKGGTYTAGTGAGGVDAVNGGAGGEGGAAPDYMEDCQKCLADLCKTEFDACFADPDCFSADGDGTGEYEAISTCIETARADGLVKRDAVRGCGVTFGASPDPDSVSLWAPQAMAATTTNLLNCLATSDSLPTNADWANDPANFPNGTPAPWPADSCAKLACTSAK
jgi:hypothetical protein